MLVSVKLIKLDIYIYTVKMFLDTLFSSVPILPLETSLFPRDSLSRFPCITVLSFRALAGVSSVLSVVGEGRTTVCSHSDATHASK